MTAQFDIPLSEGLKEAGVTRIARENATIVVQYIEKSIRFAIKRDWDVMIKIFKKQANNVIEDPITVQAIVAAISEHYVQIIEAEKGVGHPSEKHEEPPVKLDIAFEEWQKGLQARYAELKKSRRGWLSHCLACDGVRTLCPIRIAHKRMHTALPCHNSRRTQQLQNLYHRDVPKNASHILY